MSQEKNELANRAIYAFSSISTVILGRQICQLALVVRDMNAEYSMHIEFATIENDMLSCCMECYYRTELAYETETYNLNLPMDDGTVEEQHLDDCIWPKSAVERRHIDPEDDMDEVRGDIISAIDITCCEMNKTEPYVWRCVEFPIVLCFNDLKYRIHVQVDKNDVQPENGLLLCVSGYSIGYFMSSATPYLVVEHRELLYGT